jgi:hypothetical protein
MTNTAHPSWGRWKDNIHLNSWRTKKPSSIIQILREKKKSNVVFEAMVNMLTLEELLSLKLELACQASGQPLFGFALWNNLIYIVREAVLNYALAATRSRNDAAALLGMEIGNMYKAAKNLKMRIPPIRGTEKLADKCPYFPITRLKKSKKSTPALNRTIEPCYPVVGIDKEEYY